MSKLSKLVLVVLVCFAAVTAVSVSPANAADTRTAVRIAESSVCVQSQVDPLRSSSLYKETRQVVELADGTFEVSYYFVPKCLNGPVPCRLATQTVTATVDTTADAASCL
jgi:hypothetical protein